MMRLCYYYLPFLLATMMNPKLALAFMSPHSRHVAARQQSKPSEKKGLQPSRKIMKSPSAFATQIYASSSSSSFSFEKIPTKIGTWMSGPNPNRPDWADNWMPTWLVSMRPLAQFVVAMALYIFHVSVLAQRSIPFPFQLIPNNKGQFQSIGLDSLAGMATLSAYSYFQQYYEETRSKDQTPVLPKLLSSPRLKDSPWKNIWQSKYSRFTSFWCLMALLQAYFRTGPLSIWWEDFFYSLANYFPMTIAMHRSLSVLFGHSSWIAMGAVILRLIPRPQSFFQKWYTNKKDTQWVWWTIGGYYVSSWLFNIADFVNQSLLPIIILEQASESVVSQLINPEFNDVLASLVGYVAPCLTAPWWEEVLYRGFLLPALILQMKYKWAIFWSGIIFSIHHMSPTAAIPLAVLGWTWGILYAKSGNLLTTILVHAMWNSRVFLGSWLGL